MQSVGKYTYGKTSPGSYKTPPSGIGRNSRCGKTRPRSAVGSAASKWFLSGAEGIAVKLCHRGPSSVRRLNYRSANKLDVPDRRTPSLRRLRLRLQRPSPRVSQIEQPRVQLGLELGPFFGRPSCLYTEFHIIYIMRTKMAMLANRSLRGHSLYIKNRCYSSPPCRRWGQRANSHARAREVHRRALARHGATSLLTPTHRERALEPLLSIL